MIVGVHFAGHLCAVAIGIGITKYPLAVAEGPSENATLVRGLLVGLRERGISTTEPILALLDGAKVFGWRCARGVTSSVMCPGDSSPQAAEQAVAELDHGVRV